MTSQKPGLHPRNRHRSRYDMKALCLSCPPLQDYLVQTPAGEPSVNFADPQAVKMLNKALLAHFYGVAHWDIPEGFLCPPVPGRADYVHHLADLLADDRDGVVPQNASVLDIGTGANLIYPLIGAHEYHWRFTGSEIGAEAFASAQAIISANPGLSRAIRLRRQKDAAMLLAVLEKRGSLKVSQCDAYMNIIGGLTLDEPAADLAAVVAIASSYLDKPVPGTMAAVGEVGLSGEIRSITHMEQRLSEVRRLGFTQCMVPAHKVKDLKAPAGLELLPVENISRALRLLAQGK